MSRGNKEERTSHTSRGLARTQKTGSTTKMADRSDYLPAARLQDLAQTIDPKLQLEPDATQVGDPFRSCRRRCTRTPHMRQDRCIHACASSPVPLSFFHRFCRTSPMTSWRTWQHARASWRGTAAALSSRRATSSWLLVRVCQSASPHTPSCFSLRACSSHTLASRPPSLVCLCRCCRFAEKQWGTRLVGVGDTFNRKLVQHSHHTEAYKSRVADVRRSKTHR